MGKISPLKFRKPVGMGKIHSLKNIRGGKDVSK